MAKDRWRPYLLPLGAVPSGAAVFTQHIEVSPIPHKERVCQVYFLDIRSYGATFLNGAVANYSPRRRA